MFDTESLTFLKTVHSVSNACPYLARKNGNYCEFLPPESDFFFDRLLDARACELVIELENKRMLEAQLWKNM